MSIIPWYEEISEAFFNLPFSYFWSLISSESSELFPNKYCKGPFKNWNVANDVLFAKAVWLLFKSSENAGVVVELFADIKMAGKELKTLEILQKFKEQAMAKVSVLEGKQQ